jgi:hypothetical protein
MPLKIFAMTFKIWVLRNNKKQDGSMPVTIQLTHNGQRRYIKTPHVVFAPQLNRNGNIKDTNLKLVTDNIYRCVKVIIDELSFRVVAYSPDELKEYIIRKMHGAGENGIDFFDFAENYISKIKDSQPGTAANHGIMLGNLERYWVVGN